MCIVCRLFLTTTTTLLHPFNGLFSRTTCISRHQKCQPFCILLEQEMMWWLWHQPNHMQNTPPDNYGSSVPYHSVFRGRMPFLLPNQQRQSTEGKAACLWDGNIGQNCACCTWDFCSKWQNSENGEHFCCNDVAAWRWAGVVPGGSLLKRPSARSDSWAGDCSAEAYRRLSTSARYTVSRVHNSSAPWLQSVSKFSFWNFLEYSSCRCWVLGQTMSVNSQSDGYKKVKILS